MITKKILEHKMRSFAAEPIIHISTYKTNNIPLVHYLGLDNKEQVVFIQSIAKVIGRLIANRDITNKDLSVRSGLCTATITRARNGRVNRGKGKDTNAYYGTVRTYFLIADALNLSLEDMVFQACELYKDKPAAPKSYTNILRPGMVDRVKSFVKSLFSK